MRNHANVLFMKDGDVFKPIASAIGVSRGNRFTKGVPYPVFEDQGRFPNGAYIWQDGNDDQAIQVDEVVSFPHVRKAEHIMNWLDEDLNIWFDSGHVAQPARFEGKRPIYDFSKVEDTPLKGKNSNYTTFVRDPDGTFYRLAPGEDPGFSRVTEKGELIWGYSGVPSWHKAINFGIMERGDLFGPTMPLGVAGDFTGFETYFGPFHIFTRDGLYVGMVFKDGRLGGAGADVILAEAFSGQLVKPDGMDRYFILTGDQDGRITEVLGLDAVKRLKGGTYTHGEEQVALAGKALDEYQKLLAGANKLPLVRGRDALASSKPVATIYRTKVKGFKGEPIVFSSPTGTESFDSIEVFSDITIDYKKKPGGFEAVSAIPLKALDLKLRPGQKVRMDLGYIFGNTTGNKAAARAYWSNNSFSANVLNDIPNESRLEPHEWGTVTVE